MDVKFGLDVRQMVYSRALMYVQAKKILPRDGHELADYLMEFNDGLIRMLEVAHKLLEDEVALRNRPVIIPEEEQAAPGLQDIRNGVDYGEYEERAEVDIRRLLAMLDISQQAALGLREALLKHEPNVCGDNVIAGCACTDPMRPGADVPCGWEMWVDHFLLRDK